VVRALRPLEPGVRCRPGVPPMPLPAPPTPRPGTGACNPRGAPNRLCQSDTGPRAPGAGSDREEVADPGRAVRLIGLRNAGGRNTATAETACAATACWDNGERSNGDGAQAPGLLTRSRRASARRSVAKTVRSRPTPVTLVVRESWDEVRTPGRPPPRRRRSPVAGPELVRCGVAGAPAAGEPAPALDSVLRERPQARGRGARAPGADPRVPCDVGGDRGSSGAGAPGGDTADLPAAARSWPALGPVGDRIRSVIPRRAGAGRATTSGKAKAAFRRPSIPVASVGFGRGASSRAHSRTGMCGEEAGGAERASPTLGYGDSPVGLGDTPLPAGTSTAGTAGICHVRTTSFPR
jgi:hypothetical protein